MKNAGKTYFGQTRYWWVVLLAGILLVLGGFAYWLWPNAGYAVASQIFGWLLISVGIVQVCVSASLNRPKEWGWWLAGGVIDMLVGFMLVRSVILSEIVFPYSLAFIFIYKGISVIVAAVMNRQRKYRWLYLINGILMLIIGFFFLEAGYIQEMMMVSFLTSLAFIYWGFSISMVAYDLRPAQTKPEANRKSH